MKCQTLSNLNIPQMYFFKRLYFIQYKPLTPKTALSHTENLTPKNLNQKGKISMFFTTDVLW